MESMIPVLPLTLVTSQLGDACEEDEEDDWRVEQSLYAQRQFQTDFNTFEDSEEVARHVLAADWDSIKTNAALVELRREQGRLDEAEQELGTLVAEARENWGPQDLGTLEAEAVAARLKHAQPDGAAAGAAELRAVVERMGEFLGAAHQVTAKWQRALEGMSADS